MQKETGQYQTLSAYAVQFTETKSLEIHSRQYGTNFEGLIFLSQEAHNLEERFTEELERLEAELAEIDAQIQGCQGSKPPRTGGISLPPDNAADYSLYLQQFTGDLYLVDKKESEFD